MNQNLDSLPHKNIGVAVIWNQQQQVLIDLRLPKGDMAGLWEFPGGKVEAGETFEDCIQREIKEEIGIDIEVGKHLMTVEHSYANLRVTLTVHHCRHIAGIPQTLECVEVKWVNLEELDNFEFPAANQQIINVLKNGDFRGNFEIN
jgi:8-oxo-dGTP diphosphatase